MQLLSTTQVWTLFCLSSLSCLALPAAATGCCVLNLFSSPSFPLFPYLSHLFSPPPPPFSPSHPIALFHGTVPRPGSPPAHPLIVSLRYLSMCQSSCVAMATAPSTTPPSFLSAILRRIPSFLPFSRPFHHPFILLLSPPYVLPPSSPLLSPYCNPPQPLKQACISLMTQEFIHLETLYIRFYKYYFVVGYFLRF